MSIALSWKTSPSLPTDCGSFSRACMRACTRLYLSNIRPIQFGLILFFFLFFWGRGDFFFFFFLDEEEYISLFPISLTFLSFLTNIIPLTFSLFSGEVFFILISGGFFPCTLSSLHLIPFFSLFMKKERDFGIYILYIPQKRKKEGILQNCYNRRKINKYGS